jgi:hypothetical protein
MSDEKDYEVGFGKPPASTRFEKGRSGNPKGRPKGSLNLANAFNKALSEKVTVVVQGRRKSMTKLDAAVTGLVNRATKGDSKAMQQCLALAHLVGIKTGTASAALDLHDTVVLAGVMKRLGLDAELDRKNDDLQMNNPSHTTDFSPGEIS